MENKNLSAFIIEKWRLCTMKTIRRKAIVKYHGTDKKLIETFGELFEVDHKEKNVLRLVSIQKPYFGVVAVVPCKYCELVEE